MLTPGGTPRDRTETLQVKSLLLYQRANVPNWERSSRLSLLVFIGLPWLLHQCGREESNLRARKSDSFTDCCWHQPTIPTACISVFFLG
jgi:hypothetical protein